MSPTMSEASRSGIKVWQPWFTADNEDEMRRSPSYRECGDNRDGHMTASVTQHAVVSCQRPGSAGLDCSPLRLTPHPPPPPSYHNSPARCERVRVSSGSDDEGPLDMSIGRRASPTSGRGAASHPSHTDSSGVCDPDIDEHFRRSLGPQYHAVFNNNNSNSKTATQSAPCSVIRPACTTSPAATTSSQHHAQEQDSSTEMSVDDHFAKALGDTWRRLKGNTSDKKPTDEFQLAR